MEGPARALEGGAPATPPSPLGPKLLFGPARVPETLFRAPSFPLSLAAQKIGLLPLIPIQDNSGLINQTPPVPYSCSHQENRFRVETIDPMISWAITFLIIAIIAAILGFGGIAGTAAGIAKLLFIIFLVLFVISLIFGRRVPPV